ncbi:MAG: GMC family oxidoreductase [Gammaproteobacteria bacterium]|uniref:FAD-dependent oxidoreductase n=1 Tax=Nevskia sp. TaxID=1929292 RepID=UPI0040353104|nr:GMC family oxidoreductase [Gammaproteobacteria bacterium]
MLIDLKADAPRPFHDADVCIIGAGAAGLTLAQRLAHRGRRVLLIESGGADHEADVTALGGGDVVGFPYYALEHARLRFFGGTTAIWGGRCAELDEIDFEPRDWVPWSGWPFRKDSLQPYYQQAREQLQLEALPRVEKFWATLGIEPPALEASALTSVLWQFDDRWDRFGFRANTALSTRDDLTVLLHANVTRLDLNEAGTRVIGAQLRTTTGQVASVHAGTFILAAGGLENPRLLLASNRQAVHGIGNDNDQVGRYFMEHPHARGGRIHLHQPWGALSAFRQSFRIKDRRYAACLRASDELQRRQRILNTSFTPRVRRHAGERQNALLQLYATVKHEVAPTRNGRLLWRWLKRLANGFVEKTDPALPWLQLKSQSRGLYMYVRAEQAPNPNSRVRLSSRRDACDMPMISLDWRFSELDKRSIKGVVTALDAELRASGAGTVEPAEWLMDDGVDWQVDPLIGQHAYGGYHHIGTTRMSEHARSGVVDPDGRVHGVQNLYVAGSSVFPTSGWANPTLTILALAHRLADHLEQRLAA